MERVCRDNSITIVAYSVLGQGLLTDSLTREKFRTNRAAKMTGVTYDDLTPLRDCIRQISTDRHVSMAQVCLNWAMAKGCIPLVGAKDPSQLKDALGSLTFSLNEDEVRRLDDVALGRSTLAKSYVRR